MILKGFDYRDVGYIHFTVTLPEKEKVPPLWKCVVVHCLRTLKYVFRRPSRFPQESELLFVTQSVNNQRTLLPITNYLTKANWRVISIYDFPNTIIYRRAIKYFPELLRFYKNCNSNERYRIRRVFSYFALAQGWYRVFLEYFAHCNQLRTIIVANDHTLPTRCMIVSACEMGIPIVYMQHASITEKFPPLLFDYSFLDGKESYEKYKAVGGIRGKVVILGSPRFDEVVLKRGIHNGIIRNSVGVGLNSLDSIEKVIELCQFIQKTTGSKVIVRPHPRSMTTIDFSVFTKIGVSISDSRVESSYDFFTRIGVLVANESGIHLDAAIFGVPSLMYNFSDNPILDWYGYVRSGLIPLAETQENVEAFIKNPRPISVEKVQYYYAAFHTQFEGKIAETIASFLDAAKTEESSECFLRSLFSENEPGVYEIMQKDE